MGSLTPILLDYERYLDFLSDELSASQSDRLEEVCVKIIRLGEGWRLIKKSSVVFLSTTRRGQTSVVGRGDGSVIGDRKPRLMIRSCINVPGTSTFSHGSVHKDS